MGRGLMTSVAAVLVMAEMQTTTDETRNNSHKSVTGKAGGLEARDKDQMVKSS